MSVKEVLGPPAPSGAHSTMALKWSPQQWSALCLHLESKLDEERASTARALHDELGGLLVAAKMDLGQVQRGLRGQEPEVSNYLIRAQHSLNAVVAAERSLVEQLQPGLLMHIGLFAALRWYVDHLNSTRAGGFEAELPAAEVPLGARRRLALYRAAQDALELGRGSTVRLRAKESAGLVSITVNPVRSGLDAGSEEGRLLAIRHRVAAAGGALALRESAGAGTLTISIRTAV